MIHWPDHKCSMTLEHNPHLCLHQSIVEWSEDNSLFDWASDAEIALSHDCGDLWTLQWYPRTPVSCHMIAAASLGRLLEFAETYS